MTHTAQQMVPAVGKNVRLKFESLFIDCTVMDVKSSYGKVRIQVRPIAGAGLQWVELSRAVRSETELKVTA